MGIDLELLQQHRRYEDPVAGYVDEFIQLRLSEGRTVAVLSRPLGPSASMGWVVCHSFGMEQIHLGRLDVIAARSLAAAGFPVLRFFGQGYGDSEFGMEMVGLSSHLSDAEGAVGHMQSLTGVESVGILGSRLGGAVAALTAVKLGLRHVGLWDPVVRGAHYARELLRSQVLAGIVGRGEAGGATKLSEIRQELDGRGWTDVRGWHLTRQAHDEIAGVDLTKVPFAGSALIVALSQGERVATPLAGLAESWSQAGVSCSLQLVQDPFASQFGQFRWRTVEGGTSKRDTQLELDEKIAAVTSAWAVEQLRLVRSEAEVAG